MKCRIESKEYFAGFANEKILGLTPAEHLARKLRMNGYDITEDAPTVFYDDMFYLDAFILKKGASAAEGMLEEIHTGMQYHNAVISVKREINMEFINKGVRLLSINDTYIDINAEIGEGTVVYPNSHITGNVSIGRECTIGPDSIIENSTIGNNCKIIKSVVIESSMGDGCSIGPYSHIRPGNKIGNRVKVGSYAEVKNSVIGDFTVIPHLAYVGDSTVGRNCNISCGVITANYDGRTKSRTEIGDNAFIGCNSTLIAPVKVERDTYVAAGSTITDDVRTGDLAIARSRQTNKENWVFRTNRKRSEKV
ncbi:MAG: hypothetical protein JXB33_03350 [Clostridia bacterium]|nr:hypothetical protein [Clostridia bacterium]